MALCDSAQLCQPMEVKAEAREGLANRDFTAAFEKKKAVFFCLVFLGRSSANG